ncbi:MAG TPA: c-type cytochrome [Burkholderiales bacterium]|nr:c-type cytochrome [Burkholderiales bacterium]
MAEEHSSFIKSWQQLLVVVVLAFLIPIIGIALITQLVTGQRQEQPSEDTGALNRIKPVGEVVIAQGGGATGQRTGEQVFGEVCKTCHEAGLAGAPKFGDKAAWAHVIAEGEKVALDHALHGFKGMPAKGGNPDLTDDEVHRAVVYMANNGGANWKAPAVTAPAATATAAAPAGAATPATAAPASTSAVATAAPNPGTSGAPGATTVASAAAAPAAAGKPDGKKVFEGTCMVCHGQGIAGAPKFGDKAAWAPRIKQGMDALYNSALHGKNAMPPKGGNPALSDAEVKAGVDYMVAAAK